ncbi:hypothetical protein CTEN210_14677 [Chaetoceros tenuissimus]|uniref:Uncharacterized protein n=1 Tax=Chaetoceros tenuissimus TaxID=426638 RepID=A0AAD3HCI2_9STRA|nr:hypothetical protein CTEN210_14677 [Chaetoceros tenuissimus]
MQRNLEFIKDVYSTTKEWKDEKCFEQIQQALEEANMKVMYAFGDSMHRLYKQRPSLHAVEKVVRKFPSTLSHEDEDGRLPIQSAVCAELKDGFYTEQAHEYIPLLAKEGMKYDVGGSGLLRGGLLSIDPGTASGLKSLQMLCYMDVDDNDDSNVFEELRELDLFTKDDIQDYDLLLWCIGQFRKKSKFNFFTSLDPDALLGRVGDYNLPLSYFLNNETELEMFWKAGFQYHPNIGGLLFLKDDDEVILFDEISNRLGIETAMSVLQKLLHTKSDYPILHHVFTKAHHHSSLFAANFPWAFYLRDHNGRTLHQAVLASSPSNMNANSFLIASMTENQIQQKDPITTLYPFAAMAVGEDGDLDKVFYLLRKCPLVVETYLEENDSNGKNKRKRNNSYGSNAVS